MLLMINCSHECFVIMGSYKLDMHFLSFPLDDSIGGIYILGACLPNFLIVDYPFSKHKIIVVYGCKPCLYANKIIYMYYHSLNPNNTPTLKNKVYSHFICYFYRFLRVVMYNNKSAFPPRGHMRKMVG